MDTALSTRRGTFFSSSAIVYLTLALFVATAIALATFIASCSTGHSSSAAYLHFAMAVVDPCWIETTVGEPREQPLPESYITAIRESGHLPLAA